MKTINLLPLITTALIQCPRCGGQSPWIRMGSNLHGQCTGCMHRLLNRPPRGTDLEEVYLTTEDMYLSVRGC